MFGQMFFPFRLLFVIPFIILFFVVLWVWVLIDCLKSDLNDPDKILWVLIIFSFNFIGALLYILFVKGNGGYKGVNEKMASNKKIKKIYRSKKNRVIAGVCGGIGEYFNIDPALVRLLWVIFAIAGGSGILAYIIAWIIIPEEK